MNQFTFLLIVSTVICVGIVAGGKNTTRIKKTHKKHPSRQYFIEFPDYDGFETTPHRDFWSSRPPLYPPPVTSDQPAEDEKTLMNGRVNGGYASVWGVCTCGCLAPVCDNPKNEAECQKCAQGHTSQKRHYWGEGHCYLFVAKGYDTATCAVTCAKYLIGCTGYRTSWVYPNKEHKDDRTKDECWCLYRQPGAAIERTYTLKL